MVSLAAQTATKPIKPNKQKTPLQELQEHYDAGRTYQLTGSLEQAATEYKAFLAGALRFIGDANLHAGASDKADKVLTEALRFAPESAALNLDYATLLLQQDKSQEAQQFAEKAVQFDPSNSRAQYMLGSSLYHQQDYKGAKEHLEKAVVAEPKFEVGYLLGMTYIKLNDLTRATVLFNEMVAGLGDTAQIHILFGRAYREGDFLDQSIAELHKAVAKDSKVKVAHYLTAMAYLERDGESGFAEAIPELEAELKVNPQDARTHYMLGYIALKRRDAAAAESELKKSAQLDSQSPDPLISLGQIYMDAGRLDEAEKTFRKAIELTTDPSRNGYQINRAHYSLGRILLQTGREEEGKKELQISAELRDKPHPERRRGDAVPDTPADEASTAVPKEQVSPEALKKVETLVADLGPAIADSYNNLGVIAAGQKDYPSAMDYFLQAGTWNPTLATVDRNLGMAAFYANRYDQAVEPLSKHLQQQPDDVRARAALGLSLFGVQAYGKTLEVLRPIQTEVDGDPGLSYAFAVSQVKTGAYNEGIARLRELEKADPKSADVHMLLGQAFADQGQHPEALEEYREALKLDPQSQRLHYLSGLSMIRQGDPQGAEQELRTALKLDSTDVNSKYHLAFSLIQLQRQQEAVPLLREVIQQDPKYADAYYQLGKLQLEQGDTKSAVSNLETGTKLSPESDYIHYQLALAYRREEQADNAEREMKLYQTLKNSHRGRDAPNNE